MNVNTWLNIGQNNWQRFSLFSPVFSDLKKGWVKEPVGHQPCSQWADFRPPSRCILGSNADTGMSRGKPRVLSQRVCSSRSLDLTGGIFLLFILAIFRDGLNLEIWWIYMADKRDRNPGMRFNLTHWPHPHGRRKPGWENKVDPFTLGPAVTHPYD